MDRAMDEEFPLMVFDDFIRSDSQIFLRMPLEMETIILEFSKSIWWPVSALWAAIADLFGSL